MFYFIFDIFLLFIILTEFPISSGTKGSDDYDAEEFLIEFVKASFNFEKHYNVKRFNDKLKDFKDRSELYLGIMYLLREGWHCAEIGVEFGAKERTECQKYRKYLGILHEYLFRLFAGFPAVKPMFYFDEVFTFCTLNETVERLNIIAKFYFNSEFGKSKGHKLEQLFVRYYEPKLFNENELNYEGNFEKETFQEIVVQMGLELKWANEIGGSHLNLLRPKFNQILKKMLQTKEQVASTKFNIKILHVYDQMFLEWEWEINEMRSSDPFIAFLRGQSNFEQFLKEVQKDNTLMPEGCPGHYTNCKKRKWEQGYEIYFGILYLMKQNWNCVNIRKQSEDYERMRLECEKFRKYLNILYEFLSYVYAKTKVPKLSQQMPVVRPLFNYSAIEVVHILNRHSMIFFGLDSKAMIYENLFKDDKNNRLNLNLLNEKKLWNYGKNMHILNKSTHKNFENYLKKMLKRVRKTMKNKRNKKNIPTELEELRNSPFYDDPFAKAEDEVFLAFVRDPSNFDSFCKENEQKLLNICNRLIKSATTLDHKREHLEQKYEAHLGVVYLMRDKWKCAEISKEFEKTNCQTYRNYLDIFYDFLLSVHAEDERDEKAINSLLFIRKVEQFGTLIDVVKCLNLISKYYFHSELNDFVKYKKSGFIFNDSKWEAFKQILEEWEKENGEKTEGKMMEKFDEKMKEMAKSAEGKALEEKTELKKLKKEMKENVSENAQMKKEWKMKNAAFHDKFGTFFGSPFFDTIFN